MSLASRFDETYYVTQNTDVRLAIEKNEFSNALSHYQTFGGIENRAPNEFFSPSFYLFRNDDVAKAQEEGSLVNAFFVSYNGTGQKKP